MSTEAPIGLTIMEKILGLVIVLIGVITFYLTYTSTAVIGMLSVFLFAAGLVLIGLGVFIIIAKTK